MKISLARPDRAADEALVGWRRISREALADGARPRTEVLWISPNCAADRPRLDFGAAA